MLCSSRVGYVCLAVDLTDAPAAGTNTVHFLPDRHQFCWRQHMLRHIICRGRAVMTWVSALRKITVQIRPDGCSIVEEFLCLSTHSYQWCIQVTVAPGNPAFFAAPGAAFSPAPPAGQLWSHSLTDSPLVASYTDREKKFCLYVLIYIYIKHKPIMNIKIPKTFCFCSLGPCLM